MAKERTIETQVEIDAPVEAVWKALTDAQELTNWFPPEARVKPGVGGSIWVRWDEFAQFDSPITVWEPNKRIKLVYCEAVTGKAVPPGGFEIPFQVAVDYYLQAKRGGGGTILRLVHSGFSGDAAWDTQYDGTVRGWDFQLWGLKHYLERHRGTKREVVQARAALDGLSIEEAWKRLMSPRGLLARGTLERLRRGDRYAVTTAAGDRLEGRIDILRPRDLAATIENLNDGLLRVWVDAPSIISPQGIAWLWISTFELPPASLRTLREHVASIFADLFAPVRAAP